MKAKWGFAVASAAAVGLVMTAAWSGSGAAGAGQQPSATSDKLLIDDFSARAGMDSPENKWEFVPGRGAGRATAGSVQVQEQEGRRCLHLAGVVPNTGVAGFIQARWSLFSKRRPLDARLYDGVRLSVRGNGETYAIHLRTKDTHYAGQYYRAEFQANGQWQEVKLPFGSFVPAGLRQPLSPAALTSVAVVAGKREFSADIYVSEIALYREENMNRNLTPEEERVIIRKGTEQPFTGKYYQHFEKGVYTCRRCGAELFESSSKFRSDCGWPSFDEQIPGHVKWQPDADGRRTEIICANCGAHLGHVFVGEQLTEKNTRYCVNSISMDFIPAEQRVRKTEDAVQKTEDRGQKAEGGAASDPQSAIRNPQSPGRAIFASGCFWGTEYYMQRAPGVISTTVGFTGGHVDHPTYKQVCTGRTGHAESVEIIYDPSKTSYEKLAKLFFETHDFTQWNRQGPDIGTQYRSAIFYLDDEQKQIAERLVAELRRMGYNVKTEITKAGPFWPAEDYHQDYYNKTGKTPYCHIYRPIFKPQPSEAAKP